MSAAATPALGGLHPHEPPAVFEPPPVLVVDDDTALTSTLADILRLHGHSPRVASTGREAVRLCADQLPAVVITDLRLPDMHGMELVSAIHQLSELVEIIVLTGNATLETAIAALRERSIDYLLKPVKVEQLLHVVSVAGERWRRRVAQAGLAESEARYRLLFDQNPQPVWLFDLATLRFVAVNDAAVRHYGYSRDEFLAMTVEDIRPPEDVQALRHDVAQPKRRDRRTWRHQRKDGSVIQVDISASDIVFGGRPSRIVLAVDVTDRVMAKRALEIRVRQQAAVAALGQLALTTMDVDSLLTRAVDVVADTLDVPLVAILERRGGGRSALLRHGRGWEPGLVGTAELAADARSPAGYTFTRGEPVIVEDLAGADAQRFPEATALLAHGVRSGVTVEIPGNVESFGVLGAHDRARRDFTEDDVHFLQAVAHVIGTAAARRRSDAAFQQVQRLEAVGRLAGSVAHDFNNILAAITGFAELLKAGLPAGDHRAEDVDEILRASDRAAGLTSRLLAFSRQQVLQPTVLDLNQLVTDMTRMLRPLLGAGIRLETCLDPNAAPVIADPVQLQQVVLNLCVNARDAMPEGGTLRIETANAELDARHTAEHSITAQGAYVKLAVSDTGVGMDEETRARVFEPFFTTKGDLGTGLGLPTVYGIVKQSGGEIVMHSAPGCGTTFEIFLPAR